MEGVAALGFQKASTDNINHRIARRLVAPEALYANLSRSGGRVKAGVATYLDAV